MIVEGIVTSVSSDGQINVAPMGPIVSNDFETLLLRPFQPSTTFNNLSQTQCGVFHVVDQVDLIARAAIGQLHTLPQLVPASKVRGVVLQDCCRWFEFVVESVDASDARSRMISRIVHRGERRPFFGFNRARHAVLEAAILATRLHLISRQEVEAALPQLRSAVEKTGGPAETESLQMLEHYMIQKWTTTEPRLETNSQPSSTRQNSEETG